MAWNKDFPWLHPLFFNVVLFNCLVPCHIEHCEVRNIHIVWAERRHTVRLFLHMYTMLPWENASPPSIHLYPISIVWPLIFLFIAWLKPTLEVISIEVSECSVLKIIIIKLFREKLAQFRPPTTFKDVILVDYWLDKIKEAQKQYRQKVEVSSMKEGQGSTIPSEVPPKLNVTLVDYWMPKT